MYSLIIFDWDGTLMDSVGHIVTSMQAAISELALPDLPVEAIRNIIGLGLPEAVQTLYPQADAHQNGALCQAYSKHYFAGDTMGLRLFPGAEQMLETLAASGYLLAIATGKSRAGLDRLLTQHSWRNYFHASRCADETRSKPHPLMLKELMEAFNCAPSQALMIGDSEFDLQMARNAGVDSVGVSYGVHAPERLLQHGPELIINELSELADWLAGRQQVFVQS